MRLVVADAGPINYLVLIGCIELLPILFERVVLPATVYNELTVHKTPLSVRTWISHAPHWLEVREETAGQADDTVLESIDAGERAAIQLAVSLGADLLLMDDRKGVSVAREKGLRVTGTLGVLDLAAERGLVDFGEVIQKLERTRFHRPKTLLDSLLRKHKESGGTRT